MCIISVPTLLNYSNVSDVKINSTPYNLLFICFDYLLLTDLFIIDFSRSFYFMLYFMFL